MRLIRLSHTEREGDFKDLEGVKNFFHRKLQAQDFRFYLPPRKIDEKQFFAGERLIFSWKGKVVWTAEASGAIKNNKISPTNYPLFFTIARNSLQEADHQYVVKLLSDHQARPLSPKKFGTRNWSRLDEDINIETLWNELRNPEVLMPGELPAPTSRNEGRHTTVTVNRYERIKKNRDECIKAHGTRCAACGFSFAAVYGESAAGFIHVHHRTQLSSVGQAHEVDPVTDLEPLCPNCHAVAHLNKSCLQATEVRKMISSKLLSCLQSF